MTESNISIAAVGDIAFVGENFKYPSRQTFREVEPVFNQSDLVIGNLESPLVKKGTPVPGKCTLKGDPAWAEIMKASGLHFLSLANNHLMDFGVEGLQSTLRVLKKAGIKFAGAGMTSSEANAPQFIDIKRHKIAILSRTSVIVNSPSYASKNKPGVAFLDIGEIETSLGLAKKEADIAILCLHWGLERYAYPSPRQRKLAEDLSASGADLIIGHHPHAIQGIEKINSTLVAYSLGNFVFSDFTCNFSNSEETPQPVFISLSEAEREGIILNIELRSKNGMDYVTSFTRVHKHNGLINDLTPSRAQAFSKLSAFFPSQFYKNIWKAYSIHREWELRFKPRLTFKQIISNFLRIRPRHIQEVIRTISKSAKITTEKSTNPYD
jgi:hypothetical protein